MASGKTPEKDLLKAEEQQQASAVTRVTSLPLLSSALNLVSSAYNQTKETHPCLSGVCSVAETVAAVAVGSVVGGAQPILTQLEPQIALVNEFACKGLDQLEENLPFLQQPADKVISDTKQLVTTKVTSAMDAACEAKAAMAGKVTEAVDLTKNVVGDSVKLTRSVVTSTVNSAVEAAQGAKDLVTNKVTEVVDVSKHLVEDSVERTKSAVASTIVNAVEAAQGAKELVTNKVTVAAQGAKDLVTNKVTEAAQSAKDLVTNKVTEAVDVSKHLVEDSVERTKSAVASTIVNAVEAAQGAKELVTNKVTEVAQSAKDLVTNKVTEAVDVSKHLVEDSVEQTKSAVASTIVNAVEAAQGAKELVTNKVTVAAQGAKELVTNKVTEAVDVSKHLVEDSVERTKSAVASTIVNAVEAAQDAKELMTHKVTEAVDLSKHIVEDGVGRTKSVVASTIVNAVEAAQGAKDLVATKVTETVDLTKHIVEDSVELTKSAVASTITAAAGAAQGAKDLVTSKVTEAVDKTKGAVQESVEKTKSVVTSTVSTALDAAYGTISSTINTALEQGKGAIQEGVEMTNAAMSSSISKAKAVGQAVAGGMESVLGLSEDLVDHYLPVTEEELGVLAAAAEGAGVASVEEQREQQSYFVRLGSLSNRARRRAYQLSLSKLHRLGQSTQDALARLQRAIELIESVKQEVGQKLLDGQQKLHQLWVDWCLTQPKGVQIQAASKAEVESRTLAMLRFITQQLPPAYETLKTSIQGLPGNIQEAVCRATRNIHKLHSSFCSAVSFQDLSSTTLSQSLGYVAEARRSVDDLLEYVTQNTPLSWLVGPFRAGAKGPQEGRKHRKKDAVTDGKSLALEKATSSKEVAKMADEAKGAGGTPGADGISGAGRTPGKGCEVLEKMEEKAEKDPEVALAAKKTKPNAPEEGL